MTTIEEAKATYQAEQGEHQRVAQVDGRIARRMLAAADKFDRIVRSLRVWETPSYLKSLARELQEPDRRYRRAKTIAVYMPDTQQFEPITFESLSIAVRLASVANRVKGDRKSHQGIKVTW